MENSDCPQCHEKSITKRSKFTLVPGGTTTCPNCRAKITVPKSAFWVPAVIVGGAILSMYIPGTWGFVVFVAFFLLGCWIHNNLVPLIVKS